MCYKSLFVEILEIFEHGAKILIYFLLSFLKGKQTRKVTCKRKDDGSIVKKAVCEKGGLQKPADERSCNTQPCPAEYVIKSHRLQCTWESLRRNAMKRLKIFLVIHQKY